jgi:hypothetical protein
MHTYLLELDMERFSQAEHIGFGGCILRRERYPLQARRRCHQEQPTPPALCQVLAKVVRQAQMRFDVQAQTLLQGPVVHGQKIASSHRPRVGNHEANIQIMGGFLQLLEEIVGGEIQSNGSIVDAECLREFVPERFERGEPSGHEHQMQSTCCQLPCEFLADA